MSLRHRLVAAVAVIAAAAALPFTATAAAVADVAPAAAAVCPPVTRVRFFPRSGEAARLAHGRFTGSNESRTNAFETLAEIKDAPPEGQWSEITLDKPVRYRYLKYESPNGGWGNVAEVEFYSGDTKLGGDVFGTAGSRDNSGNDFRKAIDGDTTTFFDAVEPNSQYVGIDLGPSVQAAAPVFSPPPGSHAAPVKVTITSKTPGAKIRFVRNSGGAPRPDWGDEYTRPVEVKEGTVFAAIAYTDTLAPSAPAVAAYRIGKAASGKTVRTFHVGNSLTDTIDGWLKPVAESAGNSLDFHRFTIPGAPTDWLWEHPGSGFGDSRYTEAFFALAPIDHLFTQPFAGHSRDVANESEYSGRFYRAARKHSPNLQMWLYVQWPDKKFGDNWSQAKGTDMEATKRTPATTWEEGVANHVAFAELVRERMQRDNPGKTILVVPGGPALARLKTEIEAGRVPGLTDFFATQFSDDLHLSAPGRYLVALVHYACIYRESPEGKVGPLTSGLTPAQARIFGRIAWETVKGYRWSGVAAPRPVLSKPAAGKRKSNR